MKNLLYLTLLLLGSCAAPNAYQRQLEEVLVACPRADSLRQLLRDTPRAEREAMSYLIAYMPQGDRDTMSLDLLRENVTAACRVREQYPWTAALPDSIFLNEVLPYAVVDEVRDGWREDFYRRFSPHVAACTDLQAAIDSVNRVVCGQTGVDYNTAREKINQSPRESMRQGMASCTGLSILLVDALRAVGIPARFAGTLAWHDDRGNHSWVEVWIDGEWHFTEFYPSTLDGAWLLADAGRADPADRRHGIFAVSFRPMGDFFPMAWSEGAQTVPGVEVSQRYRDRYAVYTRGIEVRGTHVAVRFEMFLDAKHVSASTDRVAANVDVFCNGKQKAGGRTAGPRQDMNDVLQFLLEKNRSYVFRYENAQGGISEVTAQVEDEPVTVRGYMQ